MIEACGTYSSSARTGPRGYERRGEEVDVDERKWKSLDDERTGDGDSVDPLPGGVQNLQCADLVLLPQNCETLPRPSAPFEITSIAGARATS